jgi:hypothetical protein
VAISFPNPPARSLVLASVIVTALSVFGCSCDKRNAIVDASVVDADGRDSETIGSTTDVGDSATDPRPDVAEVGIAPDVAPLGCKFRETVAVPSLAMAKEGQVLWSRELDRTAPVGTAVLTGNRIGVSAGDAFYLFDKKGASIKTIGTPSGTRMSAPVSDGKGRFFVASDRVIAVSESGEVEWARSWPGDAESAIPETRLAYEAAADRVHAVHVDGLTLSARAVDGEILRRENVTPPGATGADMFSYLAGGMNGVLATSTTSTHALVLFPSGETGRKELGWPRGAGAARTSPWTFVSGVGLLATWYEFDRRGQISSQIFSFFDLDGRLLSHLYEAWLTSTAYPQIVDIKGRMMVLRGSSPRERSQDRFEWYDCNGNKLGEVSSPPLRENAFWLGGWVVHGADGTTYQATSARVADHSELFAFDLEMKEKWRLPLVGLGDVSWELKLTLADDGVLYMVMQKKATGQAVLVAVQTRSPGMAKTPLPSYNHDTGASKWAQ